jgi:hypothetical protein
MPLYQKIKAHRRHNNDHHLHQQQQHGRPDAIMNKKKRNQCKQKSII